MAQHTEDLVEAVTVGELSGDEGLGLDLEILEGHEGLGNSIRSLRVQKLGLALAGLAGSIHSDRVQIIGGSEMSYLLDLEPEVRAAAIRRLRGRHICCMIVTRGLMPPREVLQFAREEKTPLLRTSALSSVSIAKITEYLEARLAPTMTIHGVLLDVFGLGVLLLGQSGIGKSECALELVLKGHRLIADDYVVIRRRGLDRLIGAGGARLKHHMELRGLGVVDIKELFGVSATEHSQNIDFAVQLERWRPDAEYDRLGLDSTGTEFLGVSIPLIEMPVAPGRNVATLVEVAARIQLLKQLGHAPSGELRKMAPEPSTSNTTEDRAGGRPPKKP